MSDRGHVHALVAASTVLFVGLPGGVLALLFAPVLLLICGSPNHGQGAAACEPALTWFMTLGPVPMSVVAATPALVALVRRGARGHLAAVATWVLAGAFWVAWGLLFAELW